MDKDEKIKLVFEAAIKIYVEKGTTTNLAVDRAVKIFNEVRRLATEEEATNKIG